MPEQRSLGGILIVLGGYPVWLVRIVDCDSD
jgi:hypothetical protein